MTLTGHSFHRSSLEEVFLEKKTWPSFFWVLWFQKNSKRILNVHSFVDFGYQQWLFDDPVPKGHSDPRLP